MTSERLLTKGLAVARVAPVLALVMLHGLAIGRSALALIALLITVVGLLAGWRPSLNRTGEILVGAVGGLLGGLALLVSATPPGPLPPVVLSPLCGGLTLLSCAWLLTGRLTASWTAAVLLVVAATSAPPVLPLMIPGLATLGLVLGCLFLLVHAASFSAVRAGAFVGYVALVGLGTAGITRLMSSGEGMLLPLFEALLESDAFASGLGLQSMVPLASYSTATLSDRVVFELGGPAPDHLRGQVMDVFNGKIWTASEAIQQPVASPMLPEDTAVLTLTAFTGLSGNLPAPAGVATRDGALPDFTAGWLVSGKTLRGDEVALTWDVSDQLPTEAPPDASLRALPDDLAAALRPLAGDIIGDAQTTAERAQAIAAHFRANHAYALTSDLRGEGHPLVVLIEQQKPAYCVYFASAMAALLRSVAVHTRLVGGFLAVETNPLTGRTMVRKRDAHAWVEVWLPEEGRWRAYDPTPSREAVVTVEEPGLLRAVQDALIRLVLRIRSHPDAVLRELLLSPPVLVLIVLGALWSLRQRLRGSRSRRRTDDAAVLTDPTLWPLYARYLSALSARGIVPGATESDTELLVRVVAEAPELAEASAAFVMGYRTARYGGGEADLEALVAQVEG